MVTPAAGQVQFLPPHAAQPGLHRPKGDYMDELLIVVENLQAIHQRNAREAMSDGATGDSGESNDGN